MQGVTKESRSIAFLIQLLAINVQRGNVASVMATIPYSRDWGEVSNLPPIRMTSTLSFVCLFGSLFVCLFVSLIINCTCKIIIIVINIIYLFIYFKIIISNNIIIIIILLLLLSSSL